MADEKTDRRSQRTRRLLANALVELMREKRFDAITVQDILDRADVGRSTFYGHFSNKEALLYDSLGELLHSLERHIAQEGDALNTAQAPADPAPHTGATLLPSLGLFRHVRENQLLYGALFASRSLDLLTRNVQQQLALRIEHNLAALLPADRRPAVPLPVLADFVAGAFYTLLRWWMESNEGHSPEEIDAMFRRMVLPGVMAALAGGR
jgi:AcrR family transcriptional regulator